MPHNHDDFDDLPAHKPSGGNAGLIIALVVGGVLVVLCLPVAGLALYFRAGSETPANNAAMASKAIDTPKPGMGGRPAWMRENFTATVLGKTPDEVKAMFGPPDRTSAIGNVTWYYDWSTVDPVSGKVDPTTAITFQDGKAAAVSY